MSSLFARTHSVGTVEPVMIASPHTAPQIVYVHDHSKQGGRSLFVGGEDVSSTNGYHILTTASEYFEIPAGESMFAITTGDTIDVQVLISRM